MIAADRRSSTSGPADPSRVLIINPLGAALAHYTSALESNLREAGRATETLTFLEPSRSGRSSWRWVVDYARALRSARNRARGSSASRILITWPVLGHLDLLLCRVLLGAHATAHVILHDPRPLVSARGYSRLARSLGNLVRGRHGFVLHCGAALREVRRQGLPWNPPILPHPVLPDIDQSASGMVGDVRPVVRVLGQYKADRDLDLLAGLAERLSSRVRLEIVGRGWPTIPGWNVREGFVDEATLGELIATSAAIVIPYTRFYQSGIAVRSLEAGTPFVGPRDSSLASLYSVESPLLVGDCEGMTRDARLDLWTEAVLEAVISAPERLSGLARSAQRQSSASWNAWLSETGGSSAAA